jgi:hypothetical protein
MRIHQAIQAAALVLVFAAPARSQPVAASPSPLVRADASGTLGWLMVRTDGMPSYDDWYSSLYGGGSAGWYWTDHLKTEVEGGRSAEVERHVYRSERLDNQWITRESTFRVGTRRLAIAQLYQFYRNVGFHPYLGAGIDLAWERKEQEDEPVLLHGPTGPAQVIDPGGVHPPRTDLVTRPFAAVGFKAYASPRVFFRTDLKVAMRGGVDEVFLRLGFGVDF